MSLTSYRTAPPREIRGQRTEIRRSGRTGAPGASWAGEARRDERTSEVGAQSGPRRAGWLPLGQTPLGAPIWHNTGAAPDQPGGARGIRRTRPAAVGF
jgi:hypothetical protein